MKNELRNIAKEKRSALNIDEISAKVKAVLFSCREYQNAKNILCYYSFGNEICTTDYFDDISKTWYLPKVCGDDLLICKYDKNKLKANKYGILEPTCKEIDDFSIIDLIIIPALCVDRTGYRIGYGKGYYDRFLKKIKCNPVKIVLISEELIFSDVCHDDYDEKCDIIVTEKAKYYVN
ncbi:5-formyltetrahydrofolate cyclo-ligase [bacterium]|nr:5-formyltetrahydrofolate cyclo-ligase [bacterium]